MPSQHYSLSTFCVKYPSIRIFKVAVAEAVVSREMITKPLNEDHLSQLQPDSQTRGRAKTVNSQKS
jgi:hypothetical protein